MIIISLCQLILLLLHIAVDPRDDCPAAIPVPYASANVKYLDTGTIVEYTCLEGFALRGGNSIFRCNLKTNTWPTGNLPKCGM